MKKGNQQHTTDPIDKKEEVPQSKDKHIKQDFPGFPHPPSEEKTIKQQKHNNEEQLSDGSANAFSESENDILRGEMDDDNEKSY